MFAVHLDRTMTAVPSIHFLGVVFQFAMTIMSVARIRYRLLFNSMLASYEYDSKNGQANHDKTTKGSSHDSSGVNRLLLSRSRDRA
jgi:hypothetical protein